MSIHCQAGHDFPTRVSAGCAACHAAVATFEHARWLDCAAGFAKERARRQELEQDLGMDTPDAERKPHEEDWRIIGRLANHHNRLGLGLNKPIGTFADDARARLAVQAPAMARLLLKNAWVSNNGEPPRCAHCGAEGYWTTEPQEPSKPDRWFFDEASSKHASDCALVAVLNAAGVL